MAKPLFYSFFLASTLLSISTTAPAVEKVVVGTFESGQLPILNPDANEDIKYLWYEYLDARVGKTEVSPLASRTGNYGVMSTITSVNAGASINQLQFYTYKVGYGWHYLREKVESGTWKLNTYNRLRFWIKMPPQAPTTQPNDGMHNFVFGTYTRSTSTGTNTAESGNGHWYHQYKIPYTGEWHQVIVDWHPHHQRSAPGSQEEGVKQYPTGETGYNYFDLLTRVYFEVGRPTAAGPYQVLIDDVEVYQDPNDENVEDIYGVSGTYIPKDNELLIGWSRKKTANGTVNEVRYSFEDIHKIGWASAIPAPNGINPVYGETGYNAVQYSTQQIDFSGKSKVYVAIKPQTSNRFRQIEIPLSVQVGVQSPPSPPTDIGVTREL